MKYVIVVDTQRSATVIVDAETDEEAFEAAEKVVTETPEDADWNPLEVSCCTVTAEIENYNPEYDRAYEEKRDRCFA